MTVKKLIETLQRKCKDDTQFAGKTVYFFTGNEDFAVATKINDAPWLRNAVILCNWD